MRIYKSVSIQYFCNYILSIYDPVFYVDECFAADIKHCPVGSKLLGISLNNVVNIDLSKQILQYPHTQIGGKINILTSGTFMKRLPKPWKLPVGQNIYVSKKGKLTWRRETNIYLGITSSKQDDDGFVSIDIDIHL